MARSSFGRPASFALLVLPPCPASALHAFSCAPTQSAAIVEQGLTSCPTPSLSSRAAIIYNSAKDAEEVADRLSKKWNQTVKAYQCNVSESEKVKSTFAQIEKDLGEIHGVVANSGISVVKTALELGKEDFDKVFGVNVFGVFNTAQAAAACVPRSLARAPCEDDPADSRSFPLPSCSLWTERKQGGSIVVISSMSDTIVNSPITQVRRRDLLARRAASARSSRKHSP